jgi:hypothetical protein
MRYNSSMKVYVYFCFRALHPAILFFSVEFPTVIAFVNHLAFNIGSRGSRCVDLEKHVKLFLEKLAA